jgi:UrcA family protein
MAVRTLIAAAALMMAAAAPALAQGHVEANDAAISVSVQLGDLNLNTPAGAKTAMGRITTAARQICGDDSYGLSLPQRLAAGRCRVAAVQQAIAAARQPMLTALAFKTAPRMEVASR